MLGQSIYTVNPYSDKPENTYYAYSVQYISTKIRIAFWGRNFNFKFIKESLSLLLLLY